MFCHSKSLVGEVGEQTDEGRETKTQLNNSGDQSKEKWQVAGASNSVHTYTNVQPK